jgi:hypothetical protein
MNEYGVLGSGSKDQYFDPILLQFPGFLEMSNCPFPNCQNFPLQTVKIFLFQTVKISRPFQKFKIYSLITRHKDLLRLSPSLHGHTSTQMLTIIKNIIQYTIRPVRSLGNRHSIGILRRLLGIRDLIKQILNFKFLITPLRALYLASGNREKKL